MYLFRANINYYFCIIVNVIVSCRFNEGFKSHTLSFFFVFSFFLFFLFFFLRKILFHSNNYFSMYIDLLYFSFLFLFKKKLKKKKDQWPSNMLFCLFFIISKTLRITFACLCCKEGTYNKLRFLLFL